MRKFDDLSDEYGLRLLLDGRRYHVYVSGQRAPRVTVRRFRGAIPPQMTEDYASLLRSMEDWIVQHPLLARLVRVELPIEVGEDFCVLRRHVYTTALDAYDDPEQTALDRPSELLDMRNAVEQALLAGAGRLDNARFRFKIVRRVLERRLLAPTWGTFFSGGEARFIVAEPDVDVEDVLAWSRLG